MGGGGGGPLMSFGVDAAAAAAAYPANAGCPESPGGGVLNPTKGLCPGSMPGGVPRNLGWGGKGPAWGNPKAPAAMAIMKGAGKVDEVGGGAGPGRSGELLVPAGCGGELITRHYQMHKVSITYWKCQMRGNFSQFFSVAFIRSSSSSTETRGEKGRRLL